MCTHFSFYHFSEGYAAALTVLAVGGLFASSGHLEFFPRRSTVVMLMVSTHLASFFYVCYHAFTSHSFFFGLLLHVMSELTAYDILSPCWILFLCSPFDTRVCISLTDHGFWPWSLWYQPLPHLTIQLCLVSPLLQLLSHQPVILYVTSSC